MEEKKGLVLLLNHEEAPLVGKTPLVAEPLFSKLRDFCGMDELF